DPEREQRVPARVELDMVVAVEDGRVLVRQAAPLERLAAELRPEGEDLVFRRGRALAAQPFEERRVPRDDVVIAERRRLVRRVYSQRRSQARSSAGSACAGCMAPPTRKSTTPVAAAATAKIAPTRKARW